MDGASTITREIYASLRGEVIGIHYRNLLLHQLFTSRDTVNLLSNTAFRFFNTLMGDLLDTITISIGHLTDKARMFNKYDNASLEQLIASLDDSTQMDLICRLNNILAQIKDKSTRIENWRNKWAAHRDLDSLRGITPAPIALSLKEIDEIIQLCGKFLNEFENIFQDPPETEVNITYDSASEESLADQLQGRDRLRIYPPIHYENLVYHDDGNTIINLIKRANRIRT